MTGKKTILVTLSIIIVFGAALTFWLMRDSGAPAGYAEVKNFSPAKPGEITCAAESPSCGVCAPNGKVIKDKCYLPKNSPYLTNQ